MAITTLAGALINFKNVIIKGFGLSDKPSLLYNAPNGAVQVIATLLIYHFTRPDQGPVSLGDFCSHYSGHLFHTHVDPSTA
jgi:hypothetical protein